MEQWLGQMPEIQAENENPDPVVAAAMEQAREEEEALVQRQISEGIYLAKEEKSLPIEAAKQFIEEGNQNAVLMPITWSRQMFRPLNLRNGDHQPTAKPNRKMESTFFAECADLCRARQLKNFRPGEVYVSTLVPVNFGSKSAQ